MQGFLRVVSYQPLVILHSAGLDQFVDAALPEGPVCHWVHFPQIQSPEEVLRREAARKRRRPQDTAVYFCPDDIVYRQLRGSRSVRVSWAALQCFVDETEFDASRPLQSPEFDAVMVSRDVRWKRQELAAKVSSLLMIMPHIQTPVSERSLIDELQATMKATFLLDDEHPIPRSRVAAAFKRAKVGLTLSAQEGVNKICYEYQLAGLPVVSTCNRGGRNQFLDPDTSMVVPADPDSVAAAVNELVARNLDPLLVREKVMEKLRAHRAEIIRVGQEYWDEKGRHQDFARHIYKITSAKPLIAFEERVEDELATIAGGKNSRQ